ncbi:CHRD domain-containing protein [Candidatus Poribacteria bacterium]|nr:CHRD domain-containing protein [Candidatus Poribacteria bacterium]
MRNEAKKGSPLAQSEQIPSSGRNEREPWILLSITIILACVVSGFDFPTHPFAPPSLKTIPVPKPPNLADFVQNESAAIALGKALYWDMQVGSDGIAACASCHFHAGADNRLKNQLNPGLLAGDETFQTGLPNQTLQFSDFPFHKLSNPDDQYSTVISDSNDIVSSQGVLLHNFTAIRPGGSIESGFPIFDPVFNLDGVNLRRVEPRNAPTVINAVFNFENFMNGRANQVFNGVNPFGPSDLTDGVFVNVNGTLQERLVRIPNSSLASQAVGPPMSDFEMSFTGRPFADIGKKMLLLRPLAKQLVHPLDSFLGIYSSAFLDAQGKVKGQRGLNVTYRHLITTAFRPEYWQNTSQMIRFAPGTEDIHRPETQDPRSFRYGDGIRQVVRRPARPLASNEYTQMEANFSLFFGLAIQMYESTLVSDNTPFDKYQEGDTTALTAQQLEGLDIFLFDGRCINCHGGPEFTLASVSATAGLILEPPGVIANMSGQQEVPPVATAASGKAGLIFDAALTQIAFEIEAANIAGVTGATVHLGSTTENGPVIFVLTNTGFITRLTGTLTQTDLIPAPGIATLADAINAMKNGDTYVNIATAAHPAGEIRGHLLNDTLLTFDSVLLGDRIVPPVTTAATGNAIVTIDADKQLISYGLRTKNITGVTGATMHLGLPGENGPAIFVLANTAFVSPFAGTLSEANLIPTAGAASMAEVIDAIISGKTYVVVQTAAHPEGEIRGPLALAAEAAIERMAMTVGEAFYDTGYYNIAVRPTFEDIGRGGTDPFGYPLSFSRRALLKSQGLLPPEIAQYTPDLPCRTPCDLDRVAVDGAIKTPTLRNVELTGPYNRDGGMATVRQSVDFYTRGGNFRDENIDNLSPFIAVIPNMTAERKNALVSFLLALTDDRVRNEIAPFDHPEIFVPNGARGDETQIIGDCGLFRIGGFKQCEGILRIPPVGAGGRPAAGLPPLGPIFNPFQP